MTIESILRRKGTDVTTIAPEASIKRAAEGLRPENCGAGGEECERSVGGHLSTRKRVRTFSRCGEAGG